MVEEGVTRRATQRETIRRLWPAKTHPFKDSYGHEFIVRFPLGVAEICLKTDNSKSERYPCPAQHIHLTREGRIYT